LSKFLIFDIPFISMTLRSGVVDIDVDVTANDVEIPTFRPTIADPRTLKSQLQDWHLVRLTQISWTVSLIY